MDYLAGTDGTSCSVRKRWVFTWAMMSSLMPVLAAISATSAGLARIAA